MPVLLLLLILWGNWAGAEEGAGVKVRIRQEGFDYIRDIISGILMEVMVKVRLPPMRFREITIENMEIIGFVPPRRANIVLSAPDTLAFTMEDFSVRTVGEYGGFYLVPIEKGKFDTTIKRAKLRQDMKLYRMNGKPSMRPGMCYIQVPEMDVTLDNWVHNLFSKRVAEELKDPMAEEVCRVISQLMEGISDESLRSLTTLYPLSTFGTKFKVLEGVFDKLFLDYSLVRDPLVYPSLMELAFNGEVSWLGKSGTEKMAPVLHFPNPSPPEARSKMISTLFSEYVLNTMFESLFKKRILRFIVDGDSYPRLKPLLKTTCDNASNGLEFCIGDLLTGLEEKFPNREVGFRYTLTKAPEFVFQRQKIRLDTTGHLTLELIRPSNQRRLDISRLHMDFSLFADLRTARNGSLSVTFPDSDIKLKHKKSKFKVTQEDYDLIGDLAASSLSQVFSGFTLLDKIPIPVIKRMELVDPIVSIEDSVILVHTDIKIDREDLLEAVLRIVEETNRRNRLRSADDNIRESF